MTTKLWPLLLATLAGLSESLHGAPVPEDLQGDFPFVVRFELGATDFAPGDRITIDEVRGTKEAIITNETYCVVGSYTLASRDQAELALFATTLDSRPSPVDPKQRVRIKKGNGTFYLIKKMTENGFLHVSFYPVPSGHEFGGIYFGQGNWLLRQKGWSSSPPSAAGPNQVIYEYIGAPVPAPVDLAAAYSRSRLIDAIEREAQNTGVSLQRIEVDDSEFPFLIGLVSRKGDFEKLVDQLRKLKDYEYNGSVGSHTHHVFNLVPYRAFPAETSQRIGRRLTLRQQILFDKIIQSE